MRTLLVILGSVLVAFGAPLAIGALVLGFNGGVDGKSDWASGLALGIPATVFLSIGTLAIAKGTRRRSQGNGASVGTPRDPQSLFEWLVDQCLEEHLAQLGRDKRRRTLIDEYGVVDDSLWQDRIEYVRKQVVLPFLHQRMTREQFHSAAKSRFKRLPFLTRCEMKYTFDGKPLRAVLTNYIDAAIEVAAEHSQPPVHHSRDIYDPTDFEHHCAELLRVAGWNASVQGGSGDQGVDVVAERDGTRAVFQCKLYSTPVGNSAVQQVYVGLAVYEADEAYVVSNAGYTPGAREAARATGVVLLGPEDLLGL